VLQIQNRLYPTFTSTNSTRPSAPSPSPTTKGAVWVVMMTGWWAVNTTTTPPCVSTSLPTAP